MIKSDFEVKGPLPRISLSVILPTFKNEESGINEQYLSCRNGTADSEIKCFHLVRKSDQQVIGFLGLITNTEDLVTIVNAFITVHFVFICAKFRGLGLSSLFHRCIADNAQSWIHSLNGVLNSEQELVVYLAAGVKSDEGEHFMRRLNDHIEPFCQSLGVQYISPFKE